MMPVNLLHSASFPKARSFLYGVALCIPVSGGAATQISPFWQHIIPSHNPLATQPATPKQNQPPHSPQPIMLQPVSLTAEDERAQLTLFTALTFMEPRLLTPHTAQELCLWGMEAILQGRNRPRQASSTEKTGHISPFIITLTAAQATQPARLHIIYHDMTTVLDAPAPPTTDIAAWAQLSIQFMARLRQNIPAFQTMSDEELLTDFLNGLLAHLDPYSRYIPPAPPSGRSDVVSVTALPFTRPHHEVISPAQTTASEAPASVGLTLKQTHAHFPIIGAININSPLWDLDISLGDSLINLDGHSTRNMPLAALQNALTGPKGSLVRLGFRTRDGHYITQNFVRGIMPKESVFPDHIGTYPLLKITHFSPHTAEEVSQYLSVFLPASTLPAEDLNNTAPSPQTAPAPPAALPGLILDLRGNHGGILQQAVMTAALFLDHGIIATTDGRAEGANHIWTIQGGDLTNRSPLVLLTDKDTASAAEVLAAALADQQRAVIIGSSSFGKGMVQISTIMPNGGHLSLTWGRILAPLGWPLQGVGVIPQICTSPHSLFPLGKQITALKMKQSLFAETLRQSRLLREDSPESARTALRQSCPPAPANPIDVTTALTLFSAPIAYHTALTSLPDINMLDIHKTASMSGP